LLSELIIEKINNYKDIDKNNISIIETKNIVNIQPYLNDLQLECIINLGIVNNIRRINKFHETVNERLKNGHIYVSCGETLVERTKRIQTKIPVGFKQLFRVLDFIYKRVIPKVPGFKKIYFAITNGHNRVISKAEILGRLISCGFEVLEYFEHNNLMFIISKKVQKPKFDMHASYGILFRMKRIGYKGKIIGVYKLRTMYPYSEYCQALITKENKLDKSGKISNDFRVTAWGKIFRKFWIDELPMFVNFFKGELNLVGVRPLSKNYFSRYPKELQNLRIKVKPGLIPPYYADMPQNFDEILESERQYIFKKNKNPIRTDIIYFTRAFLNIVFKGARSQ
tara:strand:+ start:3881 stop:4897 length:1017 start_codon:yes stop_codon:yes gene_type:complete